MPIETLYVTALAKPMADVLNSVVQFFDNGSTWFSAEHLFMSLSAVAVIFMIIQARNAKPVMNWVLAIVMVPAILVIPRGTANIVNITTPLEAYQVDNVPAGLLVPASLVSTISYGFQQGLSKYYHTFQDDDYNKTGMMFAAKIFEDTNRYQLSTSNQKVFDSYMDNCINTDILIRDKYTYQDLFDSADIFQFLETHATADHIDKVVFPDGQFISCFDALPKIKELVYKDADIAKANLAISASDSPDHPYSADEIEEAVTKSYASYFNGYTKTAKETLSQNLAINALQMGLKNNSARHGSNVGINYAYTQSQMNSTAQYWSMGLLAQKWIPQAQTMFFMLLIAVFPLVIVSMLLPGMTMKGAKLYMDSLIWISLWSIFYTILNFLTNTSLEEHINLLFGNSTVPGFSVNMQDPVTTLTYEYASVSGYMMMFIPLISRMLVKPLSDIMSNMSTSMMNILSHNTSQGADMVTTGNSRIADTSYGNQNVNNATSNQFRSSPLHDHGLRTEIAGGNETRTAMDSHGRAVGSSAIDTSRMNYNTGVNAHVADQVSASATKSANESMATAMSQATRFSDTHTHSGTESQSQSSSLTHQVSDAADGVKTFSENHDSRTSSNVVASVDAGIRAGYNSGESLWGYLAKDLTGFNAKIEGGVGIRMDGANGKQTMYTFQDLDKLAHNVSTIQSASQNHSGSLDDRDAIDFAKSFDANMQSAYQSQQTATWASNNSATVDANYNRAINDWIQTNYGQDSLVDYSKNPGSPENKQMVQEAMHAVVGDDYSNMYDQYKSQINNQAMGNSNFNNSQVNGIYSNEVDNARIMAHQPAREQSINFQMGRLDESLDGQPAQYATYKDHIQNKINDGENYISNATTGIPDSINPSLSKDAAVFKTSQVANPGNSALGLLEGAAITKIKDIL